MFLDLAPIYDSSFDEIEELSDDISKMGKELRELSGGIEKLTKSVNTFTIIALVILVIAAAAVIITLIVKNRSKNRAADLSVTGNAAANTADSCSAVLSASMGTAPAPGQVQPVTGSHAEQNAEEK